MNRHRGLQYHQLEKFYHYAFIVFLAGWVIPWTFLLVWYAIVINGCTLHTTREFLDGICTGPYLSPENKIPWYLDLWNTPEALTNHTDIRPPPYIESIMIGHIQVCDAEIALRQQVSKMEENRPGIVTDEMLSSLRK